MTANKNHLFPPADKCTPKDAEELTAEQRARALKAGLMMEGMERHTMRKALTAGS